MADLTLLKDFRRIDQMIKRCMGNDLMTAFYALLTSMGVSILGVRHHKEEIFTLVTHCGKNISLRPKQDGKYNLQKNPRDAIFIYSGKRALHAVCVNKIDFFTKNVVEINLKSCKRVGIDVISKEFLFWNGETQPQEPVVAKPAAEKPLKETVNPPLSEAPVGTATILHTVKADDPMVKLSIDAHIAGLKVVGDIHVPESIVTKFISTTAGRLVGAA